MHLLSSIYPAFCWQQVKEDLIRLTAVIYEILLRVCKFYKQVFTAFCFTVNNGFVEHKTCFCSQLHMEVN